MKSKITDEILQVINRIPETYFNQIYFDLKKCSRIFVWGLGRSGLVARAFAMRLRHLGRESYFVGEICPAISKNDVLIVISKTGNKSMLLYPIESAKKSGAKIISITSGKNKLAKISDKLLVLPLCDSIQFGGSLFEQTTLIFLDEFVEFYRRKEKIPFEQMQKNHVDWE